MIKQTRIHLNSMKRGKQFILNHPIAPAIPALTAAVTGLGNSITTIEALDSGWDQGKGTFLGAAEERLFAKIALRQALSAVSQVAKTLDKAAHPDVAAQLKMSNHKKTYQGTLTFGRAAVAIIEPIKQVFVDHGSAATVVEDLEALIAAVETAGNRKTTGLDSRVGKTAALRAEAKVGMSHLRKVDSILSQVYKGNVELYTAWKAAKRLQQTLPDEEESTPPPSGGGGGSGSGSGGSQPLPA
jgi:hypothetical protein